MNFLVVTMISWNVGTLQLFFFSCTNYTLVTIASVLKDSYTFPINIHSTLQPFLDWPLSYHQSAWDLSHLDSSCGSVVRPISTVDQSSWQLNYVLGSLSEKKTGLCGKNSQTADPAPSLGNPCYQKKVGFIFHLGPQEHFWSSPKNHHFGW